METANPTKDVKNKIGDKTVLRCLIFKDEFARFGITSETEFKEALTTMRKALGLPERYKSGNEKVKLKIAMKEATPEQLEAVKSILIPSD